MSVVLYALPGRRGGDILVDRETGAIVERDVDLGALATRLGVLKPYEIAPSRDTISPGFTPPEEHKAHDRVVAVG